jgi:DNA-binding NarL/FixJ family response regulator
METTMRGFVLRRLAPYSGDIKQRYVAGESFEALAEHFGCGWGTIRRFLISEDVPLRQEPRKRKLDTFGVQVIEAFRAGTDVGEIAERFSVQPQTVRNYLLDRSTLLGPVSSSDVTG